MIDFAALAYVKSDGDAVWLPEARGALRDDGGDPGDESVRAAIAEAADRSTFSRDLAGRISDKVTRYHLGAARSGLLRPLAGLIRGEVLEVGAGFGALTRALGEAGHSVTAFEKLRSRAATAALRCRDLPNVQVVCDDVANLPGSVRFDTVVMVGGLEHARAFDNGTGQGFDRMLASLASHLRPGGRLVVAVDNQIGLTSFAGFIEDHPGDPFAGIEDRLDAGRSTTLGRRDLAVRLDRAGLGERRWWYPFPDHRLPSLILSELALEAGFALDAASLIGQAARRDPRRPAAALFSLGPAWRPLVRNGLVPDLANAFLVVASREPVPAPDVLAHHLALDRPAPHGKIVRFVRAGDHVVVETEAADGTALGRTSYRPGPLWHDRLGDLVLRPGWTLAELSDWAATWWNGVVSALRSRGVETDGLSAASPLPPDFVDATPRNMIVGEDGPSFIDQEWRAPFTVEAGYLFHRALRDAFLTLDACAAPGPGVPLSVDELAVRLAAGAGLCLAPSDVLRFKDLERRFQAGIAGTVPDTREIAFGDERLPLRLSLDAQALAGAQADLREANRAVAEDRERLAANLAIEQGARAEAEAALTALRSQVAVVEASLLDERAARAEAEAQIGRAAALVDEGHRRADARHQGEAEALRRLLSASAARVAALESSTSWRATHPLRAVTLKWRRSRDLVRHGSHTMRLIPVNDLDELSDGRFVSVGSDPQFELQSDAGRLPTGWAWVTIDYDAEMVLSPQLIVYADATGSPGQVIFLPPQHRGGRMLLRLPDNVTRLRLDPDDRPGPVGQIRVTVREVGRAQLLAELLQDAPREAMEALRTAKTPAEWKFRLVQGWRARNQAAFGLDWMKVYGLGATPAAIASEGALTFSVVMPVHKVRADWLREALEAVLAQTYPYWQLICVDDGSRDPAITTALEEAARRSDKIHVIARTERRGVSASTNEGIAAATGDYIVFVDHDDVLEPHAIARLADAAAREGADIVYGDEVVTGEDPSDFLGLQARPAFSHDYYISHPFVVHPIAARARLVRAVGGLDEDLAISQDVDFVLRLLERDPVVTHVPDVLYRWRTSPGSAGHRLRDDVMATTAALKAAHLRRVGFTGATVAPGRSFNTFVATYHPAPQGRVLAVIPTKNGVALLKRCIETVQATTEGIALDICVVDHQSDDPETLRYLARASKSGVKVHPYSGPFNYSAINNDALRATGVGYDHYLFLNNDIEAERGGWLASMLDLAMRPDVGVVGATLLYPDRLVQHAGVVLGMHGAADHAFKFAPSGENVGTGSALHATRDYSAVTAACMLVRADAFRAVQGFDEALTVGFNDTDLCLRIGEAGYRVLNCSEAILLHHESASRGKSGPGEDPHPVDTRLFRERYAHVLAQGDPFFSPLLDPTDWQFSPKPLAKRTAEVVYRTIRHVLPVPSQAESDRELQPGRRVRSGRG